ncbi:hypothetical protein RVS70_06260 [Virgibacillus sp. M23]|uniref:hypothetical protein n=1 Tax=Virgibacillus sp. M23 TaxID=3079030 RepID=UPI002A919776|nr:hypothetical protein [Virgibacillus sp. M23]MDY7043807.1 hypothetical protein [Virgibacillus sp. M23]
MANLKITKITNKKEREEFPPHFLYSFIETGRPIPIDATQIACYLVKQVIRN